MTTWDGEDYQRRVEAIAAKGDNPHGEADFIGRFAPRSVLDAGCGTGRVAIELARRGVEVVGADVDRSMLATARRRAPELDWVESDLADLELGRTFDVVLMAGNVLLFTPEGTAAAVVAGCARHVVPGGWLVTGFQLRGAYGVEQYERDAAAADLEPVVRYATWDGDPFDPDGDYLLAVHRPGPSRGS